MSEQFVLRWHYQEFTLLKNLTSFLENDILTDVTISVDSHTVKAHKLVLAMCSVYFFQLFQVSFARNVHFSVVIFERLPPTLAGNGRHAASGHSAAQRGLERHQGRARVHIQGAVRGRQGAAAGPAVAGEVAQDPGIV